MSDGTKMTDEERANVASPMLTETMRARFFARFGGVNDGRDHLRDLTEEALMEFAADEVGRATTKPIAADVETLAGKLAEFFWSVSVDHAPCISREEMSLSLARAAIDHVGGELAKVRSIERGLEDEVETLTLEKRQFCGELDKARAELAGAKQMANGWESAHSEAQKAYRNAAQERDGMRSEIAALKVEHEAAGQRLLSLSLCLSDSVPKEFHSAYKGHCVDDAVALIRRLKRDLDEARAALAEATKRSDASDEEARMAKERVERLVERKEELIKTLREQRMRLVRKLGGQGEDAPWIWVANKVDELKAAAVLCDADRAKLRAMVDAGERPKCPWCSGGNRWFLHLPPPKRDIVRAAFSRARKARDEMWLDAVMEAHGMGQESARAQLEMLATENTALTNRVTALEAEKLADAQRVDLSDVGVKTDMDPGVKVALAASRAEGRREALNTVDQPALAKYMEAHATVRLVDRTRISIDWDFVAGAALDCIQSQLSAQPQEQPCSRCAGAGKVDCEYAACAEPSHLCPNCSAHPVPIPEHPPVAGYKAAGPLANLMAGLVELAVPAPPAPAESRVGFGEAVAARNLDAPAKAETGLPAVEAGSDVDVVEYFGSNDETEEPRPRWVRVKVFKVEGCKGSSLGFWAHGRWYAWQKENLTWRRVQPTANDEGKAKT
jgi:hypothetical protein